MPRNNLSFEFKVEGSIPGWLVKLYQRQTPLLYALHSKGSTGLFSDTHVAMDSVRNEVSRVSNRTKNKSKNAQNAVVVSVLEICWIYLIKDLFRIIVVYNTKRYNVTQKLLSWPPF